MQTSKAVALVDQRTQNLFITPALSAHKVTSSGASSRCYNALTPTISTQKKNNRVQMSATLTNSESVATPMRPMRMDDLYDM